MFLVWTPEVRINNALNDPPLSKQHKVVHVVTWQSKSTPQFFNGLPGDLLNVIDNTSFTGNWNLWKLKARSVEMKGILGVKQFPFLFY